MWSGETAKFSRGQVFCSYKLIQSIVFWPGLCVLFVPQSPKGYYHYYYSLQIFHTSVNWWSFTGVWVAASLLRFPGLFSVFWPISTMLWSEWYWYFFRFTTVSIPFQILLEPFQAQVFPTSISWWFLTDVWVTASLLKSLGLFSVVLSVFGHG